MRLVSLCILSGSVAFVMPRVKIRKTHDAIRRGPDGKIYVGEPELWEQIGENIKRVFDKVFDNEELRPIPIPIPIETK